MHFLSIFSIWFLVSERTEQGAKPLKKVIPLKKLHAEHLIIASLFRNFGHINSIVFNGFAICVSLEVVLVVFLLFFIFIQPDPPPREFESKYVEEGGNLELPVPLRLHQMKGEKVFQAGIVLVVTMCAFWLFSGVLHNAADNV